MSIVFLRFDISELDEVLLFSNRTHVMRLVMPAFPSNPASPLMGRGQNISAITYQYNQQGCLFWADTLLHSIQVPLVYTYLFIHSL